ncbi:MAG: hypothetical protein ISS71_05010 [Phycisphaerae bacterium]|nr:hypothetical protein [Phycisphaerae bacterium]
MEEKGSLGIFLLRDKAVAIWISSDTDTSVLHKVCVMPSEDEPGALPLQAARTVIRQGFSFGEVFVAIDCSCYTQYNLHSEFEDPRQIESTIKFDAEEAAATDAMNLAVTFEVTDIQPPGSQVTTYTADRQLLTDILLDLQEGGLDPTLMEPDIVCLTRTLAQTSNLSQRAGCLFVVLSGSHCYLLCPNPNYAPTVRTFLVDSDRDVTSVLIREVLLATASNKGSSSLESIVLIGPANRVDTASLGQGTGLTVQTETPEKSLSQTLATDSDITPAEFMIAYGAAIAARTRGYKADFRKDFMPYQGKRKVMEGSLHLLGISLTVLLLTVACFYQLKTFRMKGYVSDLEDKTVSQYKAVMYGKNPPAVEKISSKLKREYTNAKKNEDGPGAGDNKSVPAKLTFFLEAVNRCQKNVDINVQQINITERSMKVKGDTNNRTATNALLNEIKKHAHLALGSYRYDKEGARDSFEVALDPKE